MHSVVLRPLELADIESLVDWTNDEVFRSHAEWSEQPAATTHHFWEKLIAQPPACLIRQAAIIDETLVGYVDLYGDGEHERELGYVVGPSSRWGHGIGTAVAAAGVEFAFTVLQLPSVWAEAVVANEASVRVLRTIGMYETGLGEPECFLGQPSHYLRFRIDASRTSTDT